MLRFTPDSSTSNTPPANSPSISTPVPDSVSTNTRPIDVLSSNPRPIHVLSTISPPIDDLSTISPPIHDLLTISPLIDDLSTISPLIDDLSTISPPIDVLSTISPPIDVLSIISPPIDDLSTISPPIDDLLTNTSRTTLRTTIIRPNPETTSVAEIQKLCEIANTFDVKAFIKCPVRKITNKSRYYNFIGGIDRANQETQDDYTARVISAIGHHKFFNPEDIPQSKALKIVYTDDKTPAFMVLRDAMPEVLQDHFLKIGKRFRASMGMCPTCNVQTLRTDNGRILNLNGQIELLSDIQYQSTDFDSSSIIT